MISLSLYKSTHDLLHPQVNKKRFVCTCYTSILLHPFQKAYYSFLNFYFHPILEAPKHSNPFPSLFHYYAIAFYLTSRCWKKVKKILSHLLKIRKMKPINLLVSKRLKVFISFFFRETLLFTLRSCNSIYVLSTTRNYILT